MKAGVEPCLCVFDLGDSEYYFFKKPSILSFKGKEDIQILASTAHK